LRQASLCPELLQSHTDLARRWDEGGWDVVVTDLMMPGMSGWEVITAIRGRSPTMPIVLITALSDADIMRRASEWRVPVVAKPFPMAVLEAAVLGALSPTRSQS